MTQILADRIRTWLFDDALPFWASNGLDREGGGYVEYFDRASLTPYTNELRTRTVARQIYLFSHAAILGYEDGERCARHGLNFLKNGAWVSDESAWARTLNRDGSPKDATPSLYDSAFVIFACAWFYRAFTDASALKLAHKTLDVIYREFRAPGGGFWHQLPPDGPRQQNPHMHLLEAALALYEASPEDRFAALAAEIASLFSNFFYDPATKTLGELFDNDLHRLTTDQGRITEPGHHFEWAWILANAKRLVAINCADAARGLFAFAEKHGVDKSTGAVYQKIRDDGAPVDKTSRTWPNTERIKAAIALYELTGDDPAPIIAQSGKLLFDRYLDCAPRGAWIDHFDEHGTAIATTIPASTFYHVFLAFAEILRIYGGAGEIGVNAA